MQLFDQVTLGDSRITRDGYLVADAKVARVGIQTYAGHEVGKPDRDVVRVYRSPEEVFARDSLASFAHRPVTNDHPPEMVTATNWKRHAIGDLSGEVVRDGDHIRVPLTLMDKGAIDELKAGKRELSAGYTCDLDWTPGKSPSGEAYDARQVAIRINHVALVDAGRAGTTCRIGDQSSGAGSREASHSPQKDRNMPDTLRTVMVDGLSIQTTDQGAQAIEKLTRDKADAAKALADANTAHAAVVAAKDKELGTKDGEIAKLKGDVLDAAKLDAMVAERADVLAKAKTIADSVAVAGKSIPDIRRAAVVAKLGDATVKDKSDDYVSALFDTLAGNVKAIPAADPVCDAIRSGGHVQTADAATSRSAMLNDLSSAWKGDVKGAA